MVRINDRMPNPCASCWITCRSSIPHDEKAYAAVLKEIKAAPTIYAKLSEIDHRAMKARGLGGPQGAAGPADG